MEFSPEALQNFNRSMGRPLNTPFNPQTRYTYSESPRYANIRPLSEPAITSADVDSRFSSSRLPITRNGRQTFASKSQRFGIGDMFSGIGKDVGLGSEAASVASVAGEWSISPWLAAADVGSRLGMGIWQNVNQMTAISNQDQQFYAGLQFKKDQMDRMWKASDAYGLASPFQAGAPTRINSSGSNDGFVNLGSYSQQIMQ